MPNQPTCIGGNLFIRIIYENFRNTLYKDETLPKYKDNSDVADYESIDGPNINYHSTSEERAFWSKFEQTHPHPPEDLESKQLEVAQDILRARDEFGRGSKIMTQRTVDGVASIRRKRAQQMGYPPEPMTDDALFAAYVLQKSRDYQNILQGPSFMVSNLTRNFLGRLVVDPKYVTNAPTAEMIQAADAWKVPYLQRLQRENTDSSYINAYLKAWNIPASALSGAPK